MGSEICVAYAPLLGIEVVGACAEVLGSSQPLATETHLHDASWRIRRQHDGFAAEIAESVGEADIDAGRIGGCELVGRQCDKAVERAWTVRTF